MSVPNILSESWEGRLHDYMRWFFNFPEELTFREKMLFLNQSLKITFVRHPFVRLVSTFQDKVIDHPDYKGWKEKILQRQLNTSLEE